MYVVRVSTAAGELFFGPYETLKEATEFSGHKCSIFTVFSPTLTAHSLQQMTLKELRGVLEQHPDY